MDPTNSLYLWSETIPNWLMALAALAALGTFWVRKREKQEHQELVETDVRIGVQARWVKTQLDGDNRWGVLVENSLPTEARALKIICPGNNFSPDDTITIGAIPPRTSLFVESLRSDHGPWQFARALTPEEEPPTYLTQGKKFDVRHIEFTYLGKHYSHDGAGAVPQPQ